MSDKITKIDPNSPEFLAELEKTIKFTDKVCSTFGFVYNPDIEINKGIQFGLSRNKLMHGKRYCPCFFVTGNKEEDRICPCKPALEVEIPTDGYCHCQIFCTPEYAAKKKTETNLQTITHQHSRGLSKAECEFLLEKRELSSEELISLIEARTLGMVSFKLIDVREHMEWRQKRIVGTDVLIPTSSFFQTLEDAKLKTSESVVVYCQSGSRSAHCQRIFKDRGFTNVCNLREGIMCFNGEITKG